MSTLYILLLLIKENQLDSMNEALIEAEIKAEEKEKLFRCPSCPYRLYPIRTFDVTWTQIFCRPARN